MNSNRNHTELVTSSFDKYESLQEHNWLLHKIYLREDFTECEKILEAREMQNTLLGVQIKGSIHRCKGEIIQSLGLFQEAISNHLRDTETVKRVGKNMYLIGRFIQAEKVFAHLCELRPDDPEVWFSRGLCLLEANQDAPALESFFTSNSIEQRAQTYLEIAKIYKKQGQLEQARDAYMGAFNLWPEDPEILTLLGLTHFKNGEVFSAFEKLGTALTFDPRYTKAILALSSIIQDDGDDDVALTKYRVAIKQTPENFQLWNNIGMCFYSKKNDIAALSCLKYAYSLNPLSWNICHNLGLVFLRRKQYSSSFHYLSCAVNLNGNCARLYMWVAISLLHLEDVQNAGASYKRALKLDQEDFLIHLNHSVYLAKHINLEKAKNAFNKCTDLWEKIHDDDKLPEERKLVEKLQWILFHSEE